MAISFELAKKHTGQSELNSWETAKLLAVLGEIAEYLTVSPSKSRLSLSPEWYDAVSDLPEASIARAISVLRKQALINKTSDDKIKKTDFFKQSSEIPIQIFQARSDGKVQVIGILCSLFILKVADT